MKPELFDILRHRIRSEMGKWYLSQYGWIVTNFQPPTHIGKLLIVKGDRGHHTGPEPVAITRSHFTFRQWREIKRLIAKNRETRYHAEVARMEQAIRGHFQGDLSWSRR